ncbi:MAG: acyltransferase [Ruminococcus sp.]|nr:acyltransferase [Ruminococcus sp.]
MGKSNQLPQKKGFSLSVLSTSRDKLFGLATLMVILFHSYISIGTLLPNNPVLANVLNMVRSHCNKGVDMFLFMSGIGLYYSMSGKPKLREFYKKRFVRILPAVLIVSTIWFGIQGSAGLAGYLNNVFLISFFTKGVRNFWYFALILILYIVYPLIHKLYEKTGAIGFISSVAIIVAVNELLRATAPVDYSHMEIALTRIPVFLAGAWIGKHVKNGVTVSKLWVLASAIVIVGIYFFYYFKPLSESEFLHLYRYIGGFFGLAHVILFAFIFDKTAKGAFGTFLVWIGGYSMEIYLIHEKAASILNKSFHTGDSSKIAFYIAIAVITILGAMALKAACQSLEKNLFFKNDAKYQKKLKA